MIELMFGQDATDAEIAVVLIRHTEKAVSDRRRGLGLSRSKVWPKELEDRLRELFSHGMVDAEIGKLLGKTERAVTLKRGRLGLTRYSRDTRPHRPDSAATLQELREGLETVASMLRAHRTSGAYTIREIETEAQDSLARASSRRPPGR